MTRLILVRHGEPVGHEGRCVGHLDTALAAPAREELHALAQRIRSSARLVLSSDLRRCAESARILAAGWRAELRFDPRLRELSFGDWEGRWWDDIAARDRTALDAWGADWIRQSAPSGETGLVFARRVQAALDDILHLVNRAGGDVVVVSHAGWIRVATTILLHEPLGAAFARTIDYARAAVFTVSASSARLDAWNVATPGDVGRDALSLEAQDHHAGSDQRDSRPFT